MKHGMYFKKNIGVLDNFIKKDAGHLGIRSCISDFACGFYTFIDCSIVHEHHKYA